MGMHETLRVEIYDALRDTVLRDLRVGDVVRVDGIEGARCTIVGWAAADPFGPDTVQVRVEIFDTFGRVVHTDYGVHVDRDTVRAWDQ
jgi:hypothetical protein